MDTKLGDLEIKDGKIVYTLEMQVDSHELDEAQSKAEKLLETLERIGVLAKEPPRAVSIDDGTDMQKVAEELERKLRRMRR